MIIALKMISAIVLLIALGGHPYGYYVALRWIVCAVSIVSVIDAGRKGKLGWAGTFAALAILFNPIFSIHLTRSMWVPIDLIAAVLFFVSLGYAKDR